MQESPAKLILPGGTAYEVTPAKAEKESRTAHQLPEPTGYKLLIALPRSEEKTDGGIIKAEETRHLEEVGSIVGFVLKLGPDAYKDKKRFPNGPYCKEGDCILMRSYSGTRFTIQGQEMRLLNDESVEAVIEDPRGIRKA